MLVAGVNEVRVDLVGDYDQVVAFGDVRQSGQLLTGPYAAGGVVGIAHHDHLGALIDLGFQAVKIDGVVAVLILGQLVVYDYPAVLPHGVVEGAVHRRHDNHPVAGIGEGQHAHGQGGHHAGAEFHPFFLNVPVVAASHPGGDGGEQAVAVEGVAVHGVAQAALHSGLNLGSHREVHVCHPHGMDVRAAVVVPFQAVGAGAVNDFIKIILVHNGFFLSYCIQYACVRTIIGRRLAAQCRAAALMRFRPGR